MTKENQKRTSYVAFGEIWEEREEFKGFVPQEMNWKSLKERFYERGAYYGPDNPLPINIKKDGVVFCIHLCGFRIPEAPLVIALGSNAAVIGRAALCRTMNSKESIAIAY